MRKTILTAAAVMLTACSAPEQADTQADRSTNSLPPTTSEAAPSTTAEPTPTGPQRNERGNLVKKLGESAGYLDENGNEVITFSVDAVRPINCTEEFAEPPENGHFIAVDMRIATSPEMANVDYLSYFSISPVEFQYIPPGGGPVVSEISTMATYGCLPYGELLTSDQMMPGSQYAGTIVLDVPKPHGTLIYRPSMGDGTGWEWGF